LKNVEPSIRNRILLRFRLGLSTRAPIGAGSFSKHVVMVVGEQTSHPEENKYHAPFCSAKACSGWLNGLLNTADIPEAKLYWVNALDNDGTEVDLGKLAQAIEPKAIVALGNIARNQLVKHKLEHHHVPHPQYWKRFKNKEPYPLIQQLKELCNDKP
jgi:hypothetical protein